MTRRTIPAVFAGLLAAAVLVLSGCSDVGAVIEEVAGESTRGSAARRCTAPGTTTEPRSTRSSRLTLTAHFSA